MSSFSGRCACAKKGGDMCNVACLGEVVVDEYVELGARYVGGISFNVAWNLQQLGVHAEVFSLVGSDSEGYAIKELVNRHQLGQQGIKIKRGRTALQRIVVREGGDRFFDGYDAGVLPELSFQEIPEKDLRRFGAIHVPLTSGQGVLLDTIVSSVRDVCKVADFSTDSVAPHEVVPTIERYASAYDLMFIAGERQYQPAISQLAQKFPHKTFVLTLGAEGARCFVGKGIFSQPALQVRKVVDTTGCTDAFQAGFMARWLRDRDDQFGALMAGTLQAAKVAQSLGATPCALNQGLAASNPSY